MDILTPHEGLSNEQISEAQIELFEKKQTESENGAVGEGHTDGGVGREGLLL